MSKPGWYASRTAVAPLKALHQPGESPVAVWYAMHTLPGLDKRGLIEVMTRWLKYWKLELPSPGYPSWSLGTSENGSEAGAWVPAISAHRTQLADGAERVAGTVHVSA